MVTVANETGLNFKLCRKFIDSLASVATGDQITLDYLVADQGVSGLCTGQHVVLLLP